MENEPFEDVFPIENGDFPASYVSLPEGSYETPFHSIIAFFGVFCPIFKGTAVSFTGV